MATMNLSIKRGSAELALLVNAKTAAEMEKECAAAHGPAPAATLAQVADHIDHVARIAGHDHVGIGSDFFGSTDEPTGLEDVSRFPNLLAELIRRGWSDRDLKKLAGGNLLRAPGAAETAATRLTAQRSPSTATIEAVGRQEGSLICGSPSGTINASLGARRFFDFAFGGPPWPLTGHGCGRWRERYRAGPLGYRYLDLHGHSTDCYVRRQVVRCRHADSAAGSRPGEGTRSETALFQRIDSQQ